MSKGNDRPGERPNEGKPLRRPETPEDVAALYAWANLQQGKYRDFSSSRRAYRAQQSGQTPPVRRQESGQLPPAPEPAVTLTGENSRPDLDAARIPGLLEDPHSGRDRRPLEYVKRPTSFRHLPPQRPPAAAVISEMVEGFAETDPHTDFGRGAVEDRSRDSSATSRTDREPAEPVWQPLQPGYDRAHRWEHAGEEEDFGWGPRRPPTSVLRPAEQARRAYAAGGERGRERGRNLDDGRQEEAGGERGEERGRERPQDRVRERGESGEVARVGSRAAAERVEVRGESQNRGRGGTQPEFEQETYERVSAPPAWFSQQPPERKAHPVAVLDTLRASNHVGDPSRQPTGQGRAGAQQSLDKPAQPDTGDTLVDTRERVASRWFALRGMFDAPPAPGVPDRSTSPVTAFFSFAGGTGKTSVVATLGRALCGSGERVLLTDITAYGLLPYYYGAREVRPGTLRTFHPPSAMGEAPVSVVSYDIEAYRMQAFKSDVFLRSTGGETEREQKDDLLQAIAGAARGVNRVLIDIATASAPVAERVLRSSPVIVVPMVPDMNSVIGLGAVEQFFRTHRNAEGRALQPFYLLNQFDASQALHLDIRELLRQQLGERLLPMVLRRSAAVGEALAEGMTVFDYAPQSGIAEDYAALAAWLQSVQAPAEQAMRAMRWSEQ